MVGQNRRRRGISGFFKRVEDQNEVKNSSPLVVQLLIVVGIRSCLDFIVNHLEVDHISQHVLKETHKPDGCSREFSLLCLCKH